MWRTVLKGVEPAADWIDSTEFGGCEQREEGAEPLPGTPELSQSVSQGGPITSPRGILLPQ